jgi:hypothetical protein
MLSVTFYSVFEYFLMQIRCLKVFCYYLLYELISGLQIFFNLFLGRSKHQFVPRRFVIPPKEFRILYGPEVRQTVLDHFLVKISPRRQVGTVKKKPKKVQSLISSFFQSKK